MVWIKMAKGYLRHRGMGGRGNIWCKRCERNQRCKYANPVEMSQKKIEPISYGDRPVIK